MSGANEDYPGGDLSLSQLLYATKKKLRSGIVDGSFTTGLNFAEADALVQDTTEVASLVRYLRNTLVPINRMPLEVFSLVPHHLERQSPRKRPERDLISMTHVCRHWREVLTSHSSSLWTHLDFQGLDKTRAYIERSRSLPLNITLLETEEFTYCEDSFLEAVLHLDRLDSLTMMASPQTLSKLCSHLPSPALILKELKILVYDKPSYGAVSNDLPILDTIFPENSPLRKLVLSGIPTDLPWRNLSNLTVFEFRNPKSVVYPLFVMQVLDFLASAPLLRRIVICVDIPKTFNYPPRRKISLPNLMKLVVDNIPRNSTFLDHLSIPAGTSLDVTISFPRRADAESVVCLRQITEDRQHAVTVNLYALCSKWKSMRVDGPNGELRVGGCWHSWEAPFLLPCLKRFDLSKTQNLSIEGYELPPSRGDEPITNSTIFQTLHSCNLRALTLIECENQPFIHALNPGRNQPVLCPDLEELVLYIGPRERSIHDDLVEMVSERAKSSSKLSSIKIYHGEEDFSLLRDYVSYVEYRWVSTASPRWDAAFGDVEDDYNTDWYEEI